MGYQLNNDQFRQLEMFRPAGELYQGMVDNEVGAVDFLPGYNSDEDFDVKDRGAGWAESRPVVHRPVVRFFDDGMPGPATNHVRRSSKSTGAAGEDFPPGNGREYQGDGHHRVTTYGRHAPETEIPVVYSNRDYMAPRDLDRQWDQQEKTRLKWQTRHG